MPTPAFAPLSTCILGAYVPGIAVGLCGKSNRTTSDRSYIGASSKRAMNSSVHQHTHPILFTLLRYLPSFWVGTEACTPCNKIIHTTVEMAVTKKDYLYYN